MWVLPGGGVDPSESPEKATIREMLEETGYQVEILRKVAEYLPVNKLTEFTHFYEVKILSGRPSKGSETKNIRFFSVIELPRSLMPPPFAAWIADALPPGRPMLTKKVEGVSYWILLKLLILHPILVGRFLLTKMGIHINSKD